MKTTLMLVGGFLGAGKTTLLLRSARELESRGHKVALVMNDQGSDLVDTALARSQGVPVAEVVGGCFCCRFHDFMGAIQTVQAVAQPDIILAEPVGSCTDLVATVLRPLHRMYPDQFKLAAFTVLLDPNRDVDTFPATVRDLNRWQLEEADILALNKADLFSDAEVAAQMARLAQTYPGKRIVSLSAQTGAGVADWLELAMQQAPSLRNLIPIDYIVYAEAEATLGWLNAAGTLRSAEPVSLQAWAADFLGGLQRQFQALGSEIAHLKVHVRAGADEVKGSLTSTTQGVSWTEQRDRTVTEAQLIVNARVQTNPDSLRSAVESVAAQLRAQNGVAVDFHHLECFSPSPPQPTFRLA
ncbi:MAG: cobalamin biosynthesis protein P47K [Anaerolineae bacterium]|nr:cobalamin biosynthesis protein P47K [Anaerolineae bacterium]